MMKTVALISGGKDSCFNMMCCVAEGHDIVALANLKSKDKDELDSYMYQTVGHHAISLYAEAMDLPLYTHLIKGTSVCTSRDYYLQNNDEVEDLYELLAHIKSDIDIEAVSVGAILSDYQRVRVENVCQRLKLKVLAFLWRRDQEELLKEMIDCDVKAIIIKVAALGLLPHVHLGMELCEILPHMLKMQKEYGLNVCGEGGEYETFVFDCPLFKKSLVIDEKELVIHSADAFAPVAYLNLKKCHLEKKLWDDQSTLQEKMLKLPITTSSMWLCNHMSSLKLLYNEESIKNIEVNANSCSVANVDEELEQLPSLTHSDGQNFQIAAIKAIVDGSEDITVATREAMNSLMGCVERLGRCTEEIISVSLYVRNMSDFAAINSVYTTYFKINPPVRLCIQSHLPRNVVLQLDCHGKEGGDGDRKTMHVQALSHWAPANIGPYSQAVLVGQKLFVSGIVPLLPATLSVVDGGIVPQCCISIKYLQDILQAMCPSCTLASCALVLCFITHIEHIAVAREIWTHSLMAGTKEEERAISPLLQFCVVPKLPRDVLVEWQINAWPFCNENQDLKREKLLKKFSFFTLTMECCSFGDLFSCRITAVAEEESSDEKAVDIEKLADEVLVQVSSIQGYYNLESGPLVRLFYPATRFSYGRISKAFVKEVSKCGEAKFPVISFVPVSSLETNQHLLAWCQ